MHLFYIESPSETHEENLRSFPAMFYSVYLLDFGKYIVIPSTWLRDDLNVMEAYMANSGINVDHTHLCYYSQQIGATTMADSRVIPNGEFKPNFRAALSDYFPCDEGTFYCVVVDFKGRYKFKKIFCSTIWHKSHMLYEHVRTRTRIAQ